MPRGESTTKSPNPLIRLGPTEQTQGIATTRLALTTTPPQLVSPSASRSLDNSPPHRHTAPHHCRPTSRPRNSTAASPTPPATSPGTPSARSYTSLNLRPPQPRPMRAHPRRHLSLPAAPRHLPITSDIPSSTAPRNPTPRPGHRARPDPEPTNSARASQFRGLKRPFSNSPAGNARKTRTCKCQIIAGRGITPAA